MTVALEDGDEDTWSSSVTLAVTRFTWLIVHVLLTIRPTKVQV